MSKILSREKAPLTKFLAGSESKAATGNDMTSKFESYRPRLGIQCTTRHRHHYRVQAGSFGSKGIESEQIFGALTSANLRSHLRLLEKMSEIIASTSESVYSLEC